jgi:hypothetical protein
LPIHFSCPRWLTVVADRALAFLIISVRSGFFLVQMNQFRNLKSVVPKARRIKHGGLKEG